MSFTGTQGLFTGPGSSSRFSTKSRIDGGLQPGMRYPSPFFDLSHTYLPATVKALFQMCAYYVQTNGIIHTTVARLSEYPVTDILFEHKDASVQKLWTEYMNDHMRILPFHVESGFDYYTFGNSIVSLAYPLIKYLKCARCGYSENADRIHEHWRLTDLTFRLTCPSCGHIGEAKVHDYYVKNPNGIRLIRWNPLDMDVREVEVTGHTHYYYTPPRIMRSDVLLGKKSIASKIPQAYLTAMKAKKSISFSEGTLFHMRRSSLATADRGWGIPLLMPMLKDAFHMQIMRKAQESLLMENALPLRVLFPQAGSAAADPITTINLGIWQESVATEIARWRMDPSYIPILPLPIGQETIGGDAKALLLTPELRELAEHLVVTAGVAKEFVFGGVSYAGTTVSMRQVENMFIRYISRRLQMTKWIVRDIGNYMDWPLPTIRQKPFKAADDVQRKTIIMQANQAGKVSDTTFLSELDLDITTENELQVQETVKREEAVKIQQASMAKIQGEAGLVSAKYQVKAQQIMQQAQQAPAAPGEPGGPESPNGIPEYASSQVGPNSGGVGLLDFAKVQANALSGMPPQQQQMALQQMASTSPELAQMVQSMMGGGGQQQPAQGEAPLPEVLPPRRTNSPI